MRYGAGMIARLILALLLAAFALPALANGPCHDAPVAKAAPHHATHGVPRPDDRAAVTHVCIGCIPPASLDSRMIVARLPVDTSPHALAASVFAPRSGTPPTLPPPRQDA